MRIVHINVMATLSTGRVATEICETTQEMGHRTLVAFSRGYPPPSVPYLRIGNGLDLRLHGVLARLTDRSGFFSRYATRRLVRQLKSYKPDLIHLHNLHGYYLHLPTLFGYLKECGVPVVWTLHDCWAFTGHCAYFSMARCDRWLSGCGHCPCQHLYPNSLFWDRSAKNWADKRALFTAVPGLALVTPSEWLASEVSRSYLKKYPLYVIPNGIDLQTFRPCDDPALLADTVHRYHLERLNGRRMLLSVASTWEPRKGLEDLVELSKRLPDSMALVVVGLTDTQREALPASVIGLPRTAFLRELLALYTAADICLSLSHEESQGLTLIEALACGTQVLCYDVTALPETVSPDVGRVAPENNLEAVAAACVELCEHPCSPERCVARAQRFDRRRQWPQYVRLYEQLTGLAPER